MATSGARNLRMTATAIATAGLLSGCASMHDRGDYNQCYHDVATTLDGWHAAASRGDFNDYFSRMTSDAVFIGTDATEYWNRQQFEAFAKPYFDQGKGWTYTPRDRHVYFNSNYDTAWIDEKLDNAKYGQCRGMTVLRHVSGRWLIAHHTLSFAIPNDVAEPVVKIIRDHEAANPAPR
ncbi:MAG TPA: nuclear transport factor 2 family protein [Phycisphaerales bacterium]|nr:nuclear transport factor 2 family protein [Phycisphaerales bacterium]